MYSKFSEDKNFIFKLLFVLTVSFLIPFIQDIILISSVVCVIAILYIISKQGIKNFFLDSRIIIIVFIFSLILLLIFSYMEFKELCLISLRMAALFLIFSLFIRTTHINNLIIFLRKYFSPRIVFALCASLKFLPLLGGEFKDIYYLQKNRGVKLKFSNFINGSFFLSIIVPFIVISLKIINNLILTAYIKKLDFTKTRSNIYKSGKLKRLYTKSNSNLELTELGLKVRKLKGLKV